MLSRINELLAQGKSFAFETTLATKSYAEKVKFAKENNYSVTLLFFWLQNIELAKDRVKVRVAEGGHNIPDEVIERRYLHGIKNLFEIYLPLVDDAMIFDNSDGKHELIAYKTVESFEEINQEKINTLKRMICIHWRNKMS
jgi:predicted ABC-type ATPase